MKTFLLLFLFSAGTLSAQSKAEAKQLFYKSENRKYLNIPKSEFNSFYKQAKCISGAYKIKLSEMPIFQVKKTEEFLETGRFRQSLFGLGDTLFPEYTDTGKKTITCNAFSTTN